MRITTRDIVLRRGRLSIAVLCCAMGLSPVAARAQTDARGDSLAKIASLQNQVETKPAAEGWTPSALNQVLYARYRVRTGAASRAGILYSDQTLHRLNEKSEFEVQAPTADKPGLISLLLGSHYFSSRTPKQFSRIETPAVTAAIRGTEFVVEVASDTTTRITMLEGVLEASNPQGSLTVQTGEQAYVEPGKPPVKKIVVHPRDAVAWALYYPPVLGGSDAARLQALDSEGRSLARAAELLSAGQVDQAKPLIDAVRGSHPGDPVALALASVIEVAAGEKEQALRHAEEALSADPRSAAAALAVSFAAQASFDIARARSMAEKAAEEDPQSSLALARAAELRMAEGDLKGAESAARKAVERSPEESRALTVLGFAQLTQFRSAEAETLFERSVSADSASPIARLGLGLARIRRGRVDDGREELQTAVALDPDDSLLRSYLAKAYYEERRSGEAGKELATAKLLDPADPTPYLYDAIRKQNENRPAEALDDLRASVTRNDSRAVYRSRLLLDEDRAVRGTDLARIYNDLGFNQLGLVTARRSADQDQANYSSHLFLSGGYRGVPDFAPAFLSEVLQARIYQPVSVNAARPDVVNETVSFNEYTALLDRPRARAFASLAYGVTETNEKDFGSFALSDSDTHFGQAVATLNGDHFAGALAYRRFQADGFRLNNDEYDRDFRGFFEWAPTYRDSFQVNALVGKQETGDIPLRFEPGLPFSERFDTDLRNFGVGYHRVFSPGSDLAVSAIYNKTEQTKEDLSGNPVGTGILEGPQLEIQQVFRLRRTTWVMGAGGFSGEARLEAPAVTTLKADDKFENAYAYFNLRAARSFDVTAGASLEHVVAPSGLLLPRDSQLGPAEIEFSRTKVSPKLGLTFRPHPKTTLRAALYYRLNPAIGRVQTLEPTQVAGFNQFFTEPGGGTRSRTYGVGVDQEFSRRLFGGFSYVRRKLEVPEAFCSDPSGTMLGIPLPDPTLGCQFGGLVPANVILERESHDDLGSAYANVVLGKRLTFAVDYSFQRRRFDFTMFNNSGPNELEDRLETHRIRPQLRLFLPNGFFGVASANFYRQRVDQRDVYDPSDPSVIATLQVLHPNFTTIDLSAGYKLPGRYGSIVLDAINIGNRRFTAFERAIEDTVIPARVITLTLNFTL